MYALVDGEQLLLGPINFNIGMFNYELEELEIEYRVKSTDSLQVPFSITETVKILPAVNDIPAYDERFEMIGQTSHEILEDQVVFHYSKANKSLEQVKEERKALVAAERWKFENTMITLPIGGQLVTVSTSREARVSYLSKVLSSTSSGTYNFKFENDVWVEVTTADLTFIVQAIDAKVQEAFDWEIGKKQQIDACTTPQEVYDVEIGTPFIG